MSGEPGPERERGVPSKVLAVVVGLVWGTVIGLRLAGWLTATVGHVVLAVLAVLLVLVAWRGVRP